MCHQRLVDIMINYGGDLPSILCFCQACNVILSNYACFVVYQINDHALHMVWMMIYLPVELLSTNLAWNWVVCTLICLCEIWLSFLITSTCTPIKTCVQVLVRDIWFSYLEKQAVVLTKQTVVGCKKHPGLLFSRIMTKQTLYIIYMCVCTYIDVYTGKCPWNICLKMWSL